MVMENFLLMITVGLVCLNLYNALCSLEMIGITFFFKCSMNAGWRYVHVLCQILSYFMYFYEESYRAPFFKLLDYEIVVFIQI